MPASLVSSSRRSPVAVERPPGTISPPDAPGATKRHRQVNELRSQRPARHGASEASREASHLGPSRKGPGPGLAMSDGVGVSGTTEEVSNLIVNGEKSLGLPG